MKICICCNYDILQLKILYILILLIIMFPGSYSYSPGVGNHNTNVVLNPITMTPMVSGSSFTVNPLGVAGKF